MYKRNNKGPRVDPWGIPHVISICDESNPLMETNCFLLDKKDLYWLTITTKSIMHQFLSQNIMIYSYQMLFEGQ